MLVCILGDQGFGGKPSRVHYSRDLRDMRRIAAIACAFAFCVTVSPALAGECTNPNAFGTNRTLVIDNTSHPRLGSQPYFETLPLAHHQGGLTFYGGPLRAFYNRIPHLLPAQFLE